MKIMLKIFVRTTMAVALLLAGFAAGFPIGQHMGFTTGSEWAIVQADLIARESGLFMPVNLEEGTFRVIVRQSPDLSREAWRLADRYDREMQYWSSGVRPLHESVNFTQSAYLTQ
jgi:hypothetical protein